MTFSIVARDPERGQLGVAVQSQTFNTGAVVPWARAGVGVVATQAFADRRYGWRGLELLAAGTSPNATLEEMLSGDELASLRQVSILGASGELARWTGKHCVPCGGHVSGDGWAAQGNMLATDASVAMGEAFMATSVVGTAIDECP